MLVLMSTIALLAHHLSPQLILGGVHLLNVSCYVACLFTPLGVHGYVYALCRMKIFDRVDLDLIPTTKSNEGVINRLSYK